MRALAAALLVLALPAHADEALWKALQSEPGLVVFMRHAQPRGGDPLHWDETGACRGESMLTEEGKAHAKRIGEAFAAHGLKPRVIASPMCRCRDTARIAFGEPVATDPRLIEVMSADAERRRAFERAANEMIDARRGTDPIVFVSHRPNIDQLTMELIEEGELVVARRAGKDFEVLGKIAVR